MFLLFQWSDERDNKCFLKHSKVEREILNIVIDSCFVNAHLIHGSFSIFRFDVDSASNETKTVTMKELLRVNCFCTKEHFQ